VVDFLGHEGTPSAGVRELHELFVGVCDGTVEIRDCGGGGAAFRRRGTDFGRVNLRVQVAAQGAGRHTLRVLL